MRQYLQVKNLASCRMMIGGWRMKLSSLLSFLRLSLQVIARMKKNGNISSFFCFLISHFLVIACAETFLLGVTSRDVPDVLLYKIPIKKQKNQILKYSFHFLIFASRKIWSQLMQIVGLAGTAAMQPVSMFFVKFNSRLTFVRL